MFGKSVSACVVMILTMAMLTVVGCQNMPWQSKTPPPVEPLAQPAVATPGLPLSPEQRFKDIPLPVGLKEDMDRTFVFESSNLQVGRMVYTTRADVISLVNFFLQQCPAAEWKLQEVLETGGKTIMFSKPNKRMSITVQNMGVAKGRRVIITLTPEGGSVI